LERAKDFHRGKKSVSHIDGNFATCIGEEGSYCNRWVFKPRDLGSWFIED
jgi:hypothetical protein